MMFFRQYLDVPPVSRELIPWRNTGRDVSKEELLQHTAACALHPDTHQDVFVAWIRFYVEMCR